MELFQTAKLLELGFKKKGNDPNVQTYSFEQNGNPKSTVILLENDSLLRRCTQRFYIFDYSFTSPDHDHEQTRISVITEISYSGSVFEGYEISYNNRTNHQPSKFMHVRVGRYTSTNGDQYNGIEIDGDMPSTKLLYHSLVGQDPNLDGKDGDRKLNVGLDLKEKNAIIIHKKITPDPMPIKQGVEPFQIIIDHLNSQLKGTRVDQFSFDQDSISINIQNGGSTLTYSSSPTTLVERIIHSPKKFIGNVQTNFAT